MNSLNPVQIQSVMTQLNIMVSELYLLRQHVVKLEAENQKLVGQLSKIEAPPGNEPGESPD